MIAAAASICASCPILTRPRGAERRRRGCGPFRTPKLRCACGSLIRGGFAMNKRVVGSFLIAGAAALALLSISPAVAQDEDAPKGKGKAVPKGPPPKLA